jgi:hypothetical protein
VICVVGSPFYHLFWWPCAKTGTGTGCVIFAYLMLLLGCVAVIVTGTILGSGCRCSAYLSCVVALPSWALLLA